MNKTLKNKIIKLLKEIKLSDNELKFIYSMILTTYYEDYYTMQNIITIIYITSMNKENEFDNLGKLIRNEIQEDGKLTKFGALIIIYTCIALSVSLPKLIIETYLKKEKEK